MRALIGGVLIGLTLLVLAARAQDEAPDPSQTRVQQLEQTVLARDAEIVHLKAEFATCDLTAADLKRQLQSALLSADVAALIARYTATFGGQWQWNNDTRQIVPVKETP